MMTMNVRKAAATAMAVVVLVIAFYSVMFVNNAPQPQTKSQASVIAVNSDDPIGNHTDAVIEYIDNIQ